MTQLRRTMQKNAKWKPGIKVGADKSAIQKLEISGAKYCEVWYRVDQEQLYDDVFTRLKSNKIHTGLHYWGVLENNVLSNIGYPDEHIWKPTLERMKQTLEVAAKHAFHYVNIHIGAAALEKIFFDENKLELVEGSQVDKQLTLNMTMKNLDTLNTFAKNLGVQLLLETVPPFTPDIYYTLEGRHHPHATYALDSHAVELAARDLGVSVTNDLSHTACELITKDRNTLWKHLWDRTVALAPYTKLIHANTLVEPFNGTDSHDGILDEDFARNVFPTKEQISKLLSLFKNRTDVWVVCEPRDRHVENHEALVKFQKTA